MQIPSMKSFTQATLAIITYVMCAHLIAGEVTVIDDFEYDDEAAVQKAWQPSETTPPAGIMDRVTGEGKRALKISCPFTKDVDRSYLDRAVQLDLSGFSRIEMDFFVAEPKAIRNLTLYFRSGEGWYSASWGGLRKGWQTLSVSRANTGREDTPAGWHKIDGIRISPWKADDIDSYCAADNLVARSEDIAIVLGSHTIEQRSSESRTVRDCAQRMFALLEDSGISAGSINDRDLENGALSKCKIAIFAYNPILSDAELAQVEKFVSSGGKVMVFYTLHEKMAEALGIRKTGWTQKEYDGQFSEIRFSDRAIAALPEKVSQDSWNITIAAPDGKGSRVIGTWYDSKGENTKQPALLASDTGVFTSHILLNDDRPGKRRLLLALLGHYLPDVWEKACSRALEKIGEVGPMHSFDDVQKFIMRESKGLSTAAKAIAALEGARGLRSRAQEAMEERRYVDAIALSDDARTSLGAAYRLSHRSRKGEFRAVWNHSGTGAYDEGWEKSMENLAKRGFNAVVPNMWWAGVAHYDSKLLPHSRTFEERGDQIAQCVAAAKKYGIEVHPWKVNWNLSNAPKEFAERMRAEGRTQVDASGNPVNWLCPSHPENFKLELETMLEVARNYDVDGLHFDYIRYPNGNACYCDGCRERFQRDTGLKIEEWPADVRTRGHKDAYIDWRCENITRLVRATSEEARKLKPYIRISAAVFSNYPGCRKSVGQDWALWIREGYLDFVCPMDYTNSDSDFRQRVTRQVGYVGGRIPIYPGVGVTLGRWRLSPEQTIGQIEIAREAGADGFILFNYSRTMSDSHIPALAEAITAAPAIPPHNSPKISFKFVGTKETDAQLLRFDSKDQIEVKVSLLALGEHRRKAKGISGKIQLENTAGRPVESLGQCPAVGQSKAVAVSGDEGVCRLSVVGEIVFDDDSKRSFVVRSRPFVFGE